MHVSISTHPCQSQACVEGALVESGNEVGIDVGRYECVHNPVSGVGVGAAGDEVCDGVGDDVGGGDVAGYGVGVIGGVGVWQ
eukprot:45998-Karenia_brevis.AAC.1